MSDERRLKVVFMGTPAFAVPVLASVLDNGQNVLSVYTRSDRPAGRGKRVVQPAVKKYALERGLPVIQPSSLKRDQQAQRELAALGPDIIVVAAYGLILPGDIINLPRLGCLNVHPSLLPRYRGPSPVASAILEGDAVTGVTIMQLDEGMDSGPILSQRETPIGPDETTVDLTMRLFKMGAALLLEVLPPWERGEIRATPQDQSEATVTKRLTKGDGEVDWGRSAAYIARHVRANHPWPGSFTHWRGRLLRIIEASVSETESPASPGSVVRLLKGRVGICSGEGVLEVRQVQLEGRRAVDVGDFLVGHRDFLGSEVGAKV